MMDFSVLLLECRPDALVQFGPDKLIPTARSHEGGDEWAHVFVESVSVRPHLLPHSILTLIFT